MGKDLKGQLTLGESLSKIRGIGRNLAVSIAAAIERDLGIAQTTLIGSLTEKQIESIEELIRNPTAHGVMHYLLNRDADDEYGTPRELVQSDLQFSVRQDVEKEKNTHSWIGWRHSIGQKVRGQHNRTTGRTGMTVGVLKKAIKAQKEAAAKGAQDKGAAPAEEKKK